MDIPESTLLGSLIIAAWILAGLLSNERSAIYALKHAVVPMLLGPLSYFFLRVPLIGGMMALQIPGTNKQVVVGDFQTNDTDGLFYLRYWQRAAIDEFAEEHNLTLAQANAKLDELEPDDG